MKKAIVRSQASLADAWWYRGVELLWKPCWVPGYMCNADGTITDNATGLVWERKTNCNGATHCCGDGYTLAGALQYVAGLNTANFAGHNDWRLPNVKDTREEKAAE